MIACEVEKKKGQQREETREQEGRTHQSSVRLLDLVSRTCRRETKQLWTRKGGRSAFCPLVDFFGKRPHVVVLCLERLVVCVDGGSALPLLADKVERRTGSDPPLARRLPTLARVLSCRPDDPSLVALCALEVEVGGEGDVLDLGLAVNAGDGRVVALEAGLDRREC